MQGLEQGQAIKVRDAVRMGYVEGKTINDIVKSIRGTKALNYRDGVLEITKRDAKTIVRTAVSHMASVTRDRFFDANKEVIKQIMRDAPGDTPLSKGAAINIFLKQQAKKDKTAKGDRGLFRSIYSVKAKEAMDAKAKKDGVPPATKDLYTKIQQTEKVFKVENANRIEREKASVKAVEALGLDKDFANNNRSISIAGGATDIGSHEFTTSTLPALATSRASPKKDFSSFGGCFGFSVKLTGGGTSVCVVALIYLLGEVVLPVDGVKVLYLFSIS
jgi:hypothetical protein